ncbi:MAG TPA: glycoside hydrolase family 16 protein [Gemmatimonadales bacterium]|nr:glycoside hydrolase family 16 protein [Gemmatimonadales bacterium]
MASSSESLTGLARAALLIGAAVACASGAATVSPPPHPPPPRWVQVWSDEFNGPADAPVDTTKWHFDLGDGCPGVCGWGNNEKEYYRSDTANIRLNGSGQLQIVARVATDSVPCYYGRCRYTSAKITTNAKMFADQGRIEARIKLPAGQGLWPAFWTLGKNIVTVGWPTCGEMDIMENHGSDPTSMSSAVHGPGYSGNTPFVHIRRFASAGVTDFHLYAAEWDSVGIRFFVDDTLHYLVARGVVQQYGNWVYDQPFFVILNLAVGGNFDHDPTSDAIFPATMLVDYVRVYKRGT